MNLQLSHNSLSPSLSQSMETASLGHIIFATNQKSFQKKRKNPITQTHIKRRFHSHKQHGKHFFDLGTIKNSNFQDFHGYAKPSRLLAVTDLKVCTENSQEKLSSSFSVCGSLSLYKVKLHTSNMYGSSLSDPNAGILLCLIDTNGDSLLQRIPVILKSNSAESADMVVGDALHFQRGNIDEFTFKGPKLEGIEALWVSAESGQWRLGGMTLTVIDACQPSLEENGEKIKCTGFQYEFEVDDVLLGDGSGISVLEVRPCVISKLSGVDPLTLLSKSASQSTALPDGTISNEESMREYADLKLSLLSYDAMLIFVGTTVANFSAGDNASFAFFTGGIGGFLYLLLLQRSVDGLPASPSISRSKGGIYQLFRGFKGPISSVALTIGLTSLALKYGFGDVPLVLTPKELLAAMMGFLACKVAVVLAAFKPMTLGFKEIE